MSQDVQDRAVVPRSATRPAPTPPLLTRWGVTPEADVVYRALLAYGPQSPATLGRALGMPTSRVRQSLDELADAGAASRSGGPGPAGGDWRAAAPEAVVATLQRHRILAAQARHRLHRQLTGLTELGVPDPRTLPLDSVRPLYGGERIRARLTELCHREHREHLSINPEPAFDARTVRAASPLDRMLLLRGVPLLTLGVPADAGDATAGHTREATRLGLRYRELLELPTKLIVFGRHTALLPLDPDDAGRGAVELTDPATVAALVALFLRHWERAYEPGTGRRRTVTLSERETAIIQLLAAGHTDAATAAQLGLSVRTVAYTLRGLMDRYQVQNRFQLGLVLGAVAAEYVPDPDLGEEQPS